MPTGCECELVERAMRTRNDCKHPALKHGAYSAIAVLPGESRAEFEKLRRGLMAEFSPSGALEDHIVMTIAHLTWRKKNLATLRICGTCSGPSRGNLNEQSPLTQGLPFSM